MTDLRREPKVVGRTQIARSAPAKGFPTWEHLKHLRRSQVVRSMHVWLVVVPIMAKLFDQISRTPPIELFGRTFQPSVDLPFSWQLFYFSALAFSAGNLIFILRCPRIIADHANPGEFHETGKGFDQIVHYALNAGLSVDETQQHVDRTNAEVQSVSKRYNRLFWIFYDHANTQRWLGLWSAALLYSAGLGLIFVVLAQNLEAVLRLIP